MGKTITDESARRMETTVADLQRELAGIRTGRASAGLLEHVTVDYYGTPTPITQMATIATPEARLITVQPWDMSQLSVIEKAIQNSNLGITPANDGKVIRLVMPPMTEERRKELAKIAKKYGEEHKVAIRNIRRDGMDNVKKKLKAKEISEDDEKTLEAKIQKITDDYIKKIDVSVASKEKEILET